MEMTAWSSMWQSPKSIEKNNFTTRCFLTVYVVNVIIVANNWEQDLQMVAAVLVSPWQDLQPTPKKWVIGQGGDSMSGEHPGPKAGVPPAR